MFGFSLLGPPSGGPSPFRRSIFILCLLAWASSGQASDHWKAAVTAGHYDAAVQSAKQGSSLLNALIEKADTLELHKEPMWAALLHYADGISRTQSQVDSEWFFHSDVGKTNRQAELHATLAALFNPSPKPPMRLTSYCRFVARRIWLQQSLGELFDDVPVQACPEFDQFISYLNPHELTLVFPTSHPNSPASAFGHTLLRIDQPGQSNTAKLLNMSINFAAEVPQGVSALAYTFGGITGHFPGRFQLLPYHLKLREYQQIDNRDTWEYPLDLSDEQIAWVVRHTYEMLIAEFDYFFFYENCSYHLLGLLNVAFADAPLTDAFSLWTIPVDTIKVLDRRELLLDERFVPSTLRVLRQRESALTPQEQQWALLAESDGLTAIDDALDVLPKNRAAAVLDTVGDYLRYQRLKKDPSALGLNNRERQVLSRRSKLGVRSVEQITEAPTVAPQLGHGTSRLSFGTTRFRSSGNRLELGYRAAYHDMQDPALAYGRRAAIEFLSIGVAKDEEASAYLSRLTLLSIESLEPRQGFFKPLSWRTQLGWDKPSASLRTRFRLITGGGLAYGLPFNQSGVSFAFLESDIVDDPNDATRLQWHLGTRLGIHWVPQRLGNVKVGVEWEHRERIGLRRYDSSLNAWASVSPHRQGALVLEARAREQSGGASTQSVGIEWRWYF